jgi:hypothetical protein
LRASHYDTLRSVSTGEHAIQTGSLTEEAYNYMTPNLDTVLEEARKLPMEERQRLANLLLRDVAGTRPEDEEIQAARAIVAETSGSMAGLDRATLIQLAQDEEYCEY